MQWRDTLEEVGCIGRELRLLDEFLLEGDAYRHARLFGSETLSLLFCVRGALPG